MSMSIEIFSAARIAELILSRRRRSRVQSEHQTSRSAKNELEAPLYICWKPD